MLVPGYAVQIFPPRKRRLFPFEGLLAASGLPSARVVIRPRSVVAISAMRRSFSSERARRFAVEWGRPVRARAGWNLRKRAHQVKRFTMRDFLGKAERLAPLRDGARGSTVRARTGRRRLRRFGAAAVRLLETLAIAATVAGVATAAAMLTIWALQPPVAPEASCPPPAARAIQLRARSPAPMPPGRA